MSAINPAARGRPPKHETDRPLYDDGTAWLRGGFRRHSLACAVAIFAGWGGAWIALWGGAIGAVAGTFVGFGVGRKFLSFIGPLGAGKSVSLATVITGASLGAVAGTVAVLLAAVQNPIALAGSMVSGSLLSVLIVVTIASLERVGLRVRGYRRLSIDETRRVGPLVQDAADAMHLPALPRFAMTDTGLAGAWTHMRTIVLNTELLETLDDNELHAVLIHELHHWRRGDGVGLRCVWAAAWPIAITYNVGTLIATGKRPRTSQRPQSPEAPEPTDGSEALRWFIGWSIAWPSAVILRFVIAPLTAASQRRYEYEADAAAADLGFAPHLITALEKIGYFESGRTGFEAAMTRTHPPTALRIEALQPPAPDDEHYREDELRWPTWIELRRVFGLGPRSKS